MTYCIKDITLDSCTSQDSSSSWMKVKACHTMFGTNFKEFDCNFGY